MNSKTWLAGVMATTLALTALGTNTARAERWYDNKWVWGGTGLLAGGIIGNEIGKSYERDHYRYPATYAPAYTTGPYYYADGPVLTGQSYTQETRVWPFYHKITVYPIASTQPVTYNPQSVSLAAPGTAYYGNGIVGAPREDSTRDLNISLGDNNQNVRINVGRDGAVTEKSATDRKPVANYGEAHPQAAKKSNRMVDEAATDSQVQIAPYEKVGPATDKPSGAKLEDSKFSIPARSTTAPLNTPTDAKTDDKKSDAVQQKREQK